MPDAMPNMSSAIPSPCVRNCCLDDHDICMGCRRSLQEILAWSNASDEERRGILLRCQLRRDAAANRLRLGS